MRSMKSKLIRLISYEVVQKLIASLILILVSVLFTALMYKWVFGACL